MKLISIAAVVCVVLAGCSSKQDANERNFGAAIGQYLEKKGELCLGLNKWPVDVTEMDLRLQKSMPTGAAGKMAALEAVGLVSGTNAEVDQLGFFDRKPTGRKFKVKRYVLTEAGRKFYCEKEVERFGLGGTEKVMEGDICYGKKALDKVLRWEGPLKLGEYQEASVKYQYRINGLADWVKKREFQEAFPDVRQMIEGAETKEEQHTVKLTSEGWEARGID